MAAVPATVKPSPAPLPPTSTKDTEPAARHQPLTAPQIATIKSTIPLLEQHALAITTAFYASMLRAEPRMRDVFNSGNMATGRQPAALAAALRAYAAHIDDDAAVLAPAVELIAQRHASLGIRAADYAVVARYLLAAMRDVLGAAVLTDAVAAAWAAAYWQLADVFIEREAALYARQWAAGWGQQREEQEVGGWRRFRIARKERESESITSFYLEPEDGSESAAADNGANAAGKKRPLPPFRPGQYVSIRTPVPSLGAGRVQARQYSLSDAPNGAYYRVSIKREDGGSVSRAMHELRGVGDVVEVSHPQGEFYFDARDDAAAAAAPVVLISAGVGMTSVTSILNALTQQTPSSSLSSSSSAPSPKRPVTYVHCAHRTPLRAFRSHIHALSRSHGSANNDSKNALRVALFNTHVDDGDVLGEDYHFAGRLDLGKLDAERDLHVGDGRAQYFVCGPVGFMGDVEAWLRAQGVEGSRVHSEVFGPGAIARS